MIQYIKGDLFENLPKDIPFVIPHVCNDVNGFGSGFALAIKTKYPKAAQIYHDWFDGKTNFSFAPVLGEVIFPVFNKLPWMGFAHMVAQRGVVSKDNPKPIRYHALADCMEKVYQKTRCVFGLKTILAPRFGSGFARGKWDVIEELVKEIWVDRGLDIKIFEL